MFEVALIGICAFAASFLSFYSGFGLGTLLMPIIAIFFPLPIAIGLTAIIHLAHNLLKSGLLWKSIDWSIAIRFGGAALVASIPGALLLKGLSEVAPIKRYDFFSIHAEVSILHICIGLLLILFATLEAVPHKMAKIKNLFFGGALSGFFGGLSGNQGAFRSAFLMQVGRDKQEFIATNAIIAVAVDLARLTVYGLNFASLWENMSRTLLSVTIGSAFGGICLGMILLKRITFHFIKRSIVTLLYLIAILFILGII